MISGASRASASDDDEPQFVGDIVHGSDSVESAKRELAIYFGKDDLVDWTPSAAKWITE